MRLIEKHELNHVSGGEDNVLSDLIIQAKRHIADPPWEITAKYGPFGFGVAVNKEGAPWVYLGLGLGPPGVMITKEDHTEDKPTMEVTFGKDGKDLRPGVSVGVWVGDTPSEERIKFYADHFGGMYVRPPED